MCSSHKKTIVAAYLSPHNFFASSESYIIDVVNGARALGQIDHHKLFFAHPYYKSPICTSRKFHPAKKTTSLCFLECGPLTFRYMTANQWKVIWYHFLWLDSWINNDDICQAI